MQIEHEADQGPLQAGAGAHQGDEAALGDAHRALGFKQPKPLADLPVLLEPLFHAGAAPALDLNVVGFGAAIGRLGRGQVGQGSEGLVQLQLEGLLLLLEAGHLMLDGVALVAQGLHLRAFGVATTLDQLPYGLADAVSLRLQPAALLLEIALLAGDLLQRAQVERHAASPELLRDQLGVVAQQALIQHRPKASEPSLRGKVHSTCTTSLTSGMASRSLRSMPIFRVMVLLGQEPQAPWSRTFTIGPSISTTSTLPPSAIK